MKYLSQFILLLALSCSQPPAETGLIVTGDEGPWQVKYATGFSVTSRDGGTLVTINEPFPGAKVPERYLLTSQKGVSTDDEIIAIKVPLKTIVCTSTSHVPLLDYLGLSEKLVGFPGVDYISSEKVRTLIDNGKIKEIGNVDNVNLEALMALSPDVVMGYSMRQGGLPERLRAVGTKVVLNTDFLEEHPLGRAEWIKFVGLLFGKYEMADSIFREIEKEYMLAVEKTGADRPCVFSGSVYGDAWFMPGGKNYAARLLKDAGYDYSWSSDSSNGYLQLAFETVYEKAVNCEYWIAPSPYPTLESLASSDQRYSGFSAFNKGNVYTYDNIVGPTGGNMYLELGYLRPDLVVKDLIKIRDPGALPNHTLYFYRKIP